jgi:prepilin-type N-terminal cleavage/methylation domain-containing protein
MNWRPFYSKRGMSLMELVLAVAISAVLVLGLVRFLSKTVPFFQRTSVRQTVLLQARSCMETMLLFLRQGKANTLRITSSTAPLGALQLYSRVDFELIGPLSSGTTAYAIYLDKGTVYAQEYGPTPRSRVLATNVTNLVFSGDTRDPSQVYVSLRIDAPYDATHDPSRMSTLIMANQVAQMSNNQ